MKKALIFIQDGIGGAERVQMQIAKMLMDAQWDVHLCRVCYNKSTEDLSVNSFYPSGIKSSSFVYTSQFSLIHKLYSKIQEYCPNIAFSSVMNISRPLLILKPLFRNTKFIVRCNNYLYTLSNFKLRLTIFCYKFADRIISQTEEMEEELCVAGIPKQKITTLYNPLNINEINKNASKNITLKLPERINFLAVGRFAYQKGFDLLIRAFKIVSNHIPNAHLTIIGNYDYDECKVYNELKNFIQVNHIQSKVSLTGQLSNPYPLMKEADVYVLSSRWEGLPNTLIETQLLGTPAVATKCIPIISRIINHGINGFLCEPESVNDLANKMIEAVRLGRIEMTYKPGEDSEFVKIFEDLL